MHLRYIDKKCFFIALAIFAILFLATFLSPSFLLPQETRFHDSFFQLAKELQPPPAHKNEIVVVALDDLTFWKMEKQDPFPRSVFADLLTRINKGGPKLVVFDIVFRGDSEDPAEDQVFVEALRGKKNVLFPYHMGRKAVHVRTKKAFTAGTGKAGYLNKVLDSEGGVRQFYPFRLTLDRRIKDYAAELYLFGKYYDYDIKENIELRNRQALLNNFNTDKKHAFRDYEFSLLGDDTIWINYQLSQLEFNTISMYKVFDDDFSPAVFTDKIVFIGKTSELFHDIHKTPLGLMPGTYIVANTALMFLDGEFIHQVPQTLNWLLIFIFSLLMVFLCYRLPILKGFLFAVSMSSVLTTLAFLLFLKGHYLNPFKLIFVCMLGYMVINFYKHGLVVLENMQLRRLSTTDELTDLHTFRFFSIVINHEFQKCLRYNLSLSLLMIDIDNFKMINDTYGHQKGNVVLSKIGMILINNSRKSDFPARYGGEELAFILPNTNAKGAYKFAEGIRQIIEKEDYFMARQEPVKITVSIGISSFPAMNIASAEDMIRFADSALYKAKQEGKNRVVMYTPEAEKSINAG